LGSNRFGATLSQGYDQNKADWCLYEPGQILFVMALFGLKLSYYFRGNDHHAYTPDQAKPNQQDRWQIFHPALSGRRLDRLRPMVTPLSGLHSVIKAELATRRTQSFSV
jgi:hypothetical protein